METFPIIKAQAKVNQKRRLVKTNELIRIIFQPTVSYM